MFLSSKTLSSSDHPADWILNTPINLSNDASTVSINTISDRNFDLFKISDSRYLKVIYTVPPLIEPPSTAPVVVTWENVKIEILEMNSE